MPMLDPKGDHRRSRYFADALFNMENGVHETDRAGSCSMSLGKGPLSGSSQGH